jgi:spermidine synthase
MSEENKEIVVDIDAEVIEESEEEIPQMSDKQLRSFQRDKITKINRALKTIRRREKNLIMAVKKLDNK